MDNRIHDVPFEDVVIGNRFREDMGDLEGFIESVKEKGILQPITVDQDMRLITGERRYRAAKAAGLESIPCIIRAVEDDLDFREIELMENVVRKDLNWIERCMLEKEIFALQATKKGWTQRDMAEVLDQSVGSINRHLQLADAAEFVPELKECKTESEAWKKLSRIKENAVLREMGKRVGVKRSTAGVNMEKSFLVGDAVAGMATCEDAIFGFAEVDPPYAVNLIQTKRTEGDEGQMDLYQEVDKDEYEAFIVSAAFEVERLLKNNSFCIWWYGPTNYEIVKPVLSKFFEVHDIPAIWAKPVGQSQQPDYNLANAYEPFFICRKGKPMLGKPGRINIFTYTGLSPVEKIHPTQRPLTLMEDILETFAPAGTHILCPFLGSGVTIRAAYVKSMTCLGWDLSEENKQRALLEEG